MAQSKTLTNGPTAAAIMASGIGSLSLGVFTTLAEMSKVVGNALNLYAPSGPLSGKTAGAVVVWLVAWAVLNGLWKGKEVNFARVFTATLVLIALGLLGTFPLFFDLLAG